MIESLSIAVHAFVNHVSMSFLVDERLLPQLVNLSTSFRGVPSCVEMSPGNSATETIKNICNVKVDGAFG